MFKEGGKDGALLIFGILWFTQNQQIFAFFTLLYNCEFNAYFSQTWSKPLGLGDTNSNLQVAVCLSFTWCQIIVGNNKSHLPSDKKWKYRKIPCKFFWINATKPKRFDWEKSQKPSWNPGLTD